ncbi:MAG TPA: hypothetical protein VFD58_06705 [Blastocatellia bacterium]|nr:hypothetical protein [Blastocatellia bacterium]
MEEHFTERMNQLTARLGETAASDARRMVAGILTPEVLQAFHENVTGPMEWRMIELARQIGESIAAGPRMRLMRDPEIQRAVTEAAENAGRLAVNAMAQGMRDRRLRECSLVNDLIH